MFCPNCGKKLPDESLFCSACGHKLPDYATSALRERIEAPTQENPKRNGEQKEPQESLPSDVARGDSASMTYPDTPENWDVLLDDLELSLDDWTVPTDTAPAELPGGKPQKPKWNFSWIKQKWNVWKGEKNPSALVLMILAVVLVAIVAFVVSPLGPMHHPVSNEVSIEEKEKNPTIRLLMLQHYVVEGTGSAKNFASDMTYYRCFEGYYRAKSSDCEITYRDEGDDVASVTIVLPDENGGTTEFAYVFQLNPETQGSKLLSYHVDGEEVRLSDAHGILSEVMATTGLADSETDVGTGLEVLSEIEQKKLNSFLSNFSDTQFHLDEARERVKDYHDGELLLFAFLNTYLNTPNELQHATARGPYSISAGSIDKLLNRFFGFSISHPAESKTEDFAYDAETETYTLQTLQHEPIRSFSLATSYTPLKDDLIRVEFITFAYTGDAGNLPACYGYTKALAERDTLCQQTAKGTATLEPSVFNGNPTYRLVEYTAETVEAPDKESKQTDTVEKKDVPPEGTEQDKTTATKE